MSALPEDDHLTAGELALGVLEGEAREAAYRRAETDPAFAEAVRYWEARLGPLVEETAAVHPGERVWTRIEAALALGEAPSATTPRPANDDAPGARFWRRWAIGASALAAASLGALMLTAVRPDPGLQTPAAPVVATAEPMVATLLAEGGETSVLVSFDPNDGALHVAPAAGLRPRGATPYLWLVLPEGVRMVGPISAEKPETHALPPELSRMARGAKAMAVSLEPRGVEPAADKPGGPVVASGELTSI